MDFLPPVVAKLIADVGEFNAAMGASTAKLEGMAAANAKLAAAGKVAMGVLAVAVAAVGYESVKLASSFDQTMELIHTQAGAAQSEVEALKGKVLDLAPAVGIGPDKLAEGLYHIESTGFRGKEALDILAASARLAAMGLADLDTVTFAMSGVMSVAMKDVTSAADATNYLNQIVGMGDMKMEKLAAAIGTGVLPSFKSAGLGMMDFGAALATISDNSVGADEAATRLRMTVSMMAAPSHVAVGALKSIGLTATSLADDMRKPNGLMVAVLDLKKHLEESGKTASEQNAVIAKAFGGGRTSSAILTLLEESDRLKSKYEQLGTSASRAARADEAWQQQQKQFKQQMHELGAEVQVMAIKLGEWLIPKIQASAEWLTKHIGVLKIAAVIIGSVMVAAMAAWTMAVIENTVAMLADPTTWIILAIIAAVALLAIGIYELVTHWKTVWGFINRIAMDVWHWLVDAWHATWTYIKAVAMRVKTDIIDPLVRWFDTYLVRPIKIFLLGLQIAWDFAWGFFSVIIARAMHNWDIVWHAIVAVMQWAHKTVIQPIMDAINEYGIKPVQRAIAALGVAWDATWRWVSDKVTWAYNTIIKPVMDAIQQYAIGPVKGAIHDLGNVWDSIWKAVAGVVDWVWAKISPTFNKIMDGIRNIKNAFGVIANAPSDAGKAAAHLLGFAAGGWVPGPTGAAQLAVVHGGEFVLSRDMIAAGSGAPVGGGTVGQAGGAARTGAGTPYVIHSHIYLDGKEVHSSLIPHAQRYKARTGVTGLA